MTTTPEPAAFEGALRLADWGVIRAVGADARSFLHSQLTQDVLGLEPGRARLAGYCTAKGRLLASFVIWAPGADEVLLACSSDLLAPTLKRLSMFVLRAKCRLSDASAELGIWGLAGAAADSSGTVPPWRVAAGDGGWLIALPPARLGAAQVPRGLWVGAAAPVAGSSMLTPERWAALEVASGVARVVAATSEKFVPQMVNLELVGGVNFQKGCYPGQEVVARSQYRGTLKRRAFVLEGAEVMTPGQEIFNSADEGQPAGMVALAGTLLPGAHNALAELKIAATEAGTLHLGSPEGPLLRRAEQPYEIPLEAA